MHQKIEQAIRAHYLPLRDERIVKLQNLASSDLYFGPIEAEAEAEDNWPGFSKACDEIRAWSEEHLDSQVWYDSQAEVIETSEPQVEDDSDWEFYVLVERDEIKKAVFGRELADYL